MLRKPQTQTFNFAHFTAKDTLQLPSTSASYVHYFVSRELVVPCNFFYTLYRPTVLTIQQ